MAKVLGIGGIFFKSKDPQALGRWYRRWLGIPVDSQYSAFFTPDSMPEGGVTVWSPFRQDTTYFDPGNRSYMFNLVVDHLADALEQVRQGGAEIIGEIEEYDYGRFGWFMDPDGNKVELWEPKPLDG